MAYRPDWTWSSDARLPDLKPGDDIEVMFHGGSTARGNLHSIIVPSMVVAWRLHGKIPFSDPDTIRSLVWEERPGINRVDRSYVQAFG
jgi:hypothetical protein